MPLQRPPADRHPIHALLAGFPLALFTAALVTDITYANTAQMQWANFSVWLIAGGCVMAVLAALVGIVDAIRHRGRTRRRASALHGVLTVVMLVLAILNGFIHSRDGWTSVVPTGLILSLVTTVLALASSWAGYSVLSRQEVR